VQSAGKNVRDRKKKGEGEKRENGCDLAVEEESKVFRLRLGDYREGGGRRGEAGCTTKQKTGWYFSHRRTKIIKDRTRAERND